ncbi:MAG: ferredoxin-thioredoxin reductase catalytic domain-containing protein [Planctomycetota bacterium]
MSDDSAITDRARAEALAYARTFAERTGYVLNPDQAHVLRMAGLLAVNKREYGQYLCPTKQGRPMPDSVDTTCPCGTIHDEISWLGHCECGLFFHPAMTAAEGSPSAADDCPG